MGHRMHGGSYRVEATSTLPRCNADKTCLGKGDGAIDLDQRAFRRKRP